MGIALLDAGRNARWRKRVRPKLLVALTAAYPPAVEPVLTWVIARSFYCLDDYQNYRKQVDRREPVLLPWTMTCTG